MQTGIKKYGLTTVVTIIKPNIDSIFCAASRIDLGNCSSTALKLKDEIIERLMIKSTQFIIKLLALTVVRNTHPISLANRFKMRPDGLVSKKRIVVEMIPLNIASCRFCEIRTQIA